MKRIEILSVVASFLTARGSPSPAGPTSSPVPEPTPPLIGKQSTIDALSELYGNLKLPAYLTEGGTRQREGEFDANETFSVLSHLSMEPGYVLDYVYVSASLAGWPLLYARPVDQAPYLTYDEFCAATGITIASLQQDDYLEHVRVDATRDGFFELALLYLMGDQFYLFWHAGYNDATAVCDQTGLEAIVSTLKDRDSAFGEPISAKQAQQARALDLAPVVEFEGDTVTVRFVSFTKWGGFLQRTYVFAREFPHKLIRRDATNLVPYNCGMAF
jgi:hypothetical protein